MMNYKEAAKLIEENREKCFAGVDIKRKAFFDMHYYSVDAEWVEENLDDEDDYEGYVCMQYQAEIMDGVGEEASYDVDGEEDEMLESHPTINSIKFFEISEETRIELGDKIFSYQLEILGIN